MICEAEKCSRKAVWILRGIDGRKFVKPILCCERHLKRIRMGFYGPTSLRRLQQSNMPYIIRIPAPRGWVYCAFCGGGPADGPGCIACFDDRKKVAGKEQVESANEISEVTA